MRLVSSLSVVPFLLCVFIAAPLLNAAGTEEELPWALRNCYSFPAGDVVLEYAQDNAEWRLVMKNAPAAPEGLFASNIGFSITLADDKVLTGDSFDAGECGRASFTSPAGDGEQYTVVFPPKDGLSVWHRVRRYSQHLFLTMDMGVKNVGSTPLRIKEICPAVAAPGAIRNFGIEALMAQRSLAERGGSPVVTMNGPGTLTIFHDPKRPLTLAIGVLPGGRAESGTDFKASGTTWQGAAFCRYAPFAELAPGEALDSDQLWVSHGIPQISDADLRYAWVYSLLPRETQGTDGAWASVDDTEGLGELVKTANAWQVAGVKQALVPAHWEGVPGSLKGGSGRYPKDIGDAAKSLRAAGLIPGITVEPLVTQENKSWTARWKDGQTWLNPADKAAQEFASGQIRELIKGGFAFFAVAPSGIPDEVLAAFKLTRREADRLAFGIVREAAGTLPVYPVAATALPPEQDWWLEAAAATGRLTQYGVSLAPVRLDAARLDTLGESAAVAMRLWPGPIQVQGAPSSAALRALGTVLAEPRIAAYPLDGARRGPLLWQRDFNDATAGYIGAAVIAFPGVKPWTGADLNLAQSPKVAVWRQEDGAFVGGTKAVPPPERVTAYGITPINGHPSIMGASAGWSLYLDRLENLAWDHNQGMLSGTIRGPFSRTLLAHVLVPEPWTYASGKVGGHTLRIKEPGNKISFDVEGDLTRFELRFEQK